jgi:AraC-like DNA-binding protein
VKARRLLTAYRKIRFGVDTVESGDVPRHIHREGYANVLLSGSFTEAGFAGRSRVTPGMVLLHGPFDCHANIEGSGRRPTIIRLPWRGWHAEGAYRVRDPDLLARLAEHDPWGAALALIEMIEPIGGRALAWADELADALKSGSTLELSDWAEQYSLNPASVSRGFRDAYGVSPQRFRLEARARLAWRRVMMENVSLTRIAHECNFSDLAHMSRSVASLTGASPVLWRKSQPQRGSTMEDSARITREYILKNQ